MKQRVIALGQGLFIFVMALAVTLFCWGALSGFFLLVIRGISPDEAMYNPLSIIAGLIGGILAAATLTGISDK